MNWTDFPFSEFHGEGPNPKDTPPERTVEGHFVFWHGTSARKAQLIAEQRRFKPDDMGCVGIATTRTGAGIYASMKATTDQDDPCLLRIILDRDWFRRQRVTHECGGSGHDQFLLSPTYQNGRYKPVEIPPHAILQLRKETPQ